MISLKMLVRITLLLVLLGSMLPLQNEVVQARSHNQFNKIIPKEVQEIQVDKIIPKEVQEIQVDKIIPKEVQDGADVVFDGFKYEGGKIVEGVYQGVAVIDGVIYEGVKIINGAIQEGGRIVGVFDYNISDIISCNTDEVKRQLSNNWQVSYGRTIGDDEYIRLLGAAASTVYERDAEPLADFFEQEIDNLIDNLDAEARQLGKRAIADLITRAFLDNGNPQRILEGGLEIEAGLKAINCTAKFSYDEPRTYQCNQGLIPCTTLERVERSFDWLPQYLPYVRYRANADLPQLGQNSIADIIIQVEQGLNTLYNLEQSLQSQLSQAEIERRLKSEVQKIIVLEITSAVERNIPAIPKSAYTSILNEAVGRALDGEGFQTISIDQVTNQLISRLNSIISSTVSEFNNRIKEMISTSVATLTLDWAESNRSERRAEIIGDGSWFVVWGVNVDEIEYVEFGAAVAAAIPTGGASLLEYFGSYLEKTIAKIQRQAPEIDQTTLINLLGSALQSPGNVFSAQALEIQAGTATYSRWVRFNYPKIDFRRCQADIIGEYPCGFTFKIDSTRLKLPNHHQPYFKIRFTDGRSPQPRGVNSIENRTYFSNDDRLHARISNSSNRSSSNSSVSSPTQEVTYLIEDALQRGDINQAITLYKDATEYHLLTLPESVGRNVCMQASAAGRYESAHSICRQVSSSVLHKSQISTPYVNEANTFYGSVLRHLNQFDRADLGISSQSIINRLNSADTGNRINATVHRIWSDWVPYGPNTIQTDPAIHGVTPFRILVIRLIQDRQLRLADSDIHALHSLLTRSESLDTWRNDMNSIIGAINRESYLHTSGNPRPVPILPDSSSVRPSPTPISYPLTPTPYPSPTPISYPPTPTPYPSPTPVYYPPTPTPYGSSSTSDSDRLYEVGLRLWHNNNSLPISSSGLPYSIKQVMLTGPDQYGNTTTYICHNSSGSQNPCRTGTSHHVYKSGWWWKGSISVDLIITVGGSDYQHRCSGSIVNVPDNRSIATININVNTSSGVQIECAETSDLANMQTTINSQPR